MPSSAGRMSTFLRIRRKVALLEGKSAALLQLSSVYGGKLSQRAGTLAWRAGSAAGFGLLMTTIG
jgi:hypothetical protein